MPKGSELAGSPRRHVTAVLALTIVATALRAYHLDYHVLRGDETFGLFFVRNDVVALLQQLISTNEPHPPLYYLSLKAWVGLTGETEFALRWPSLLAGVALVPLAFVFWRRMGAPNAGIVAAALAAANPYQIWHSQDGRMYAIATLFSAAALYWGARVVGLGRPARPADAWGLAISSLLALYTHYVTALLVVIINAALVLRWLLGWRPQSAILRSWALAQATLAVLLLPWLFFAVTVLGLSYQGNQSSPDLPKALEAVLTTFAAGQLASETTARWLTGGMLVAATLGTVTLARRSAGSALLLLATLVLPFAAVFLVSRARPLFSERYLSVYAPILYLLAAQGVATVASVAGQAIPYSRVARVTAAAATLALMFYTGVALMEYHGGRGGEGEGGWRAFSGHVARSARPQDLVVVNHLDPSFYYYYQRLGGRAETIVQPSRAEAAAEDVDRELQPRLLPGRQVFLVVDNQRLWDKHWLIAAWLERHAVRVSSEKVAGMEVVRYRVPAGDSLQVFFGEKLVLERYELRPEAGDGLRAGGKAALDTLWRAAVPVGGDYVLTAQLLDGNGQLVSQSDGPPAGGAAPTSSWRPGESVLDTRTLILPAQPGRYTLGIAVYELPSVRRLPVPGASADLVVLGPIEIGR